MEIGRTADTHALSRRNRRSRERYRQIGDVEILPGRVRAMSYRCLPADRFRPARTTIGAVAVSDFPTRLSTCTAVAYRGHQLGERHRRDHFSRPSQGIQVARLPYVRATARCRGITATAPASGERRVAGAGTANAVFAPPKTECSAPKRPTDPGFRTPLRKTHLIDPRHGTAPARTAWRSRADPVSLQPKILVCCWTVIPAICALVNAPV
jgi:hypothetical protein